MLLQISTQLTIPDKLLQGTVGELQQRVYGDNFDNSRDFNFYGSFKLNSTVCPTEETIPDIHDDNVDPPCSIDNTTKP
jgi:hypothetical protein